MLQDLTQLELQMVEKGNERVPGQTNSGPVFPLSYFQHFSALLCDYVHGQELPDWMEDLRAVRLPCTAPLPTSGPQHANGKLK